MRETARGVVITVKVRPNSGHFALHENGALEVRARPENNAANMEIIRELGGMLGCGVRIVRGAASREKLILLEGMRPERLKSALAEL